MNLFDKAIAYLNPQAGLRRLQLRKILAAYEAGTSTRLRKFSRDKSSGNTLIKAYAPSVRDQARNLDRNHDLSRGALNVLVNNIVGPSGIGVEPQPRRKTDGSIHEDLAKQLAGLWKDWCRFPEVTQQLSWASVQRLACRTWLRDGETFAQELLGAVATLDHRTKVPYSIELLEPDMVPHDLSESGQIQGIVVNAWGQKIAYRVYKVHPGDLNVWPLTGNILTGQLKTIPAERMLHVKQSDRVGQLRGISIFASVITRLEDIKDYEESERIAAKIAASMAAYIKKGTPDLYDGGKDADGNPIARSMRFQPGMIFDDLAPGEEIGTIDTNRPNTNLQSHRDGQLRAASAGFNASYSSVSRNYNGTYSAQRQELVEQWVHYQAMTDHFISQFNQPVWERFVVMARMAGLLSAKWLAECEADSIDDALYIGQTMPWIDPQKEIASYAEAEANTYISGPEIIRKMGRNPQSTLDQQAKWVAQKKAQGIEQAAPKPTASNQPADPNQPQQTNQGATA
ncbi:MAG: phage portal protein [Mizugakiibacter sp.]|uniref:phage portal protein n=1 Tax=Mizugakiibacter sp. TaxID=1972610 RepID=UPI00320E252A